MEQEKGFKIKLPEFEGPLDLLLYLIKKNEIDIYDIPIAKITEQFLEYIEIMKALSIEVASEFIVMAAYLIYIKSCMLLPKNEVQEAMNGIEDPRMELVQQLVEYKELKEITENLKKIYNRQRLIFFRENQEDKQRVIFLDELSLDALALCFYEIIEKNKENIVYISKETLSIEDKIKEIIKLLRRNKFLKLSEITKEAKIKELVIIFLAILQLMKDRKIIAYQSKEFSDIYLFKNRKALEIMENIS